MSSALIQFPPRQVRDVWIERERDGWGWLVISSDNAWLHGDFQSALEEARALAVDLHVTVVSSAGRYIP
jgi:hypothetical protein